MVVNDIKKLKQIQTYLNIYYISLKVWKYWIHKKWKKNIWKKKRINIHYLPNYNFKHLKLKKIEENLCVKYEKTCWKREKSDLPKKMGWRNSWRENVLKKVHSLTVENVLKKK